MHACLHFKRPYLVEIASCSVPQILDKYQMSLCFLAQNEQAIIYQTLYWYVRKRYEERFLSLVLLSREQR